MAKYKYSGLHHIAFATSMMDKTVEFWRDLLGLKLVLTMEGPEGKQYAFALSNKMLVYFFEWSEVKSMPPKRHGQPVKGPFLFDHLAIQMDSNEELYRLQDQLVSADMPVTDIVDHGYIHSIYTYDPNGVPLEFNTAIAGIDLYESPLLTDETPSNIVMEGSNPVLDKWPLDMDSDTDRPVIEGEDAKLFKK